VSRGFYWDPEKKIGELSAEQRRWLLEHERLHLEFARSRGRMTPAQVRAAEADLAAFELGEEAPERPPSPWDLATDLAINSVLKEKN